MGILRSSSSSSALKWLGFVTAVWVQSISGNNYTFSNYSGALKSLMNLNQLQLNNLSVAKDVGKAFGILAGLASDRLSTPVILLIGSLEGLLGYGVQWLVVSRTITPLPYWQMCIFLCMGGNSTTWMNTAVLVTCIRNFRRNRGPVSGILKGYVGLSTAIFTDLCTALFSNDPASFLVLLAVVPFAVCLTAVFFLREIPPASSADEESEETRYFAVFNILAVVVAVYLQSYDIIGIKTGVFSVAFASVLLFLLFSPIAIPFHSFIRSLNREGRSSCRRGESCGGEEEAGVGRRTHDNGSDADGRFLGAVRLVLVWCRNNMGQIGLALGYTDVSIFVSMTSIWGFFGRILSGTLSEHFLKKAGTPRPLWNAASQILMAVGYLLMALAVPNSLYIGSMVVGVCYGVRLAITVPTASELFGLKYYGLIYNILVLNLPLGSFLFSGLLAGFLYDAEATPTPGGGNTCVGAHCYRLIFLVMALASIIGVGLDILLAYRTKEIYAKIHASKKAKSSGSDLS
ncbi:BnaC09g09080D [Brassica napus]|uniref:BnaC09g09080D protein n=1 Tax=Brassica napus TaxID=3708 RepID=A0A078GN63_BRANA|nr:BnaC09g09080D [Brassica napus]